MDARVSLLLQHATNYRIEADDTQDSVAAIELLGHAKEAYSAAESLIDKETEDGKRLIAEIAEKVKAVDAAINKLSNGSQGVKKLVFKGCSTCLGTAEVKAPDEPNKTADPPIDPDYIPPTQFVGEPPVQKVRYLKGLVFYARKETDPPNSKRIVFTGFREDMCVCLEGNSGEWIKWARNKEPEPKIESADFYPGNPADKEVRLERKPTITIIIPSSCLWIQSQVITELPGAVSKDYYNVALEADDDPCNPGGGHDTKIEENRPVPGSKLIVKHRFVDSMSCEPRFTWYGTGCLTGGRIVSVNKAYGKLDITYNVSVQGIILPKVQPTDFVRWYIGDWVFLCHDSCEDACDKKKGECRTAFTQGFEDLKSAYTNMLNAMKEAVNSEQSMAVEKEYQEKTAAILKETASHLRIIPLRIGGDGA